jgi:hypothetical protein
LVFLVLLDSTAVAVVVVLEALALLQSHILNQAKVAKVAAATDLEMATDIQEKTAPAVVAVVVAIVLDHLILIVGVAEADTGLLSYAGYHNRKTESKQWQF